MAEQRQQALASLKAMFPDIDHDILLEVLTANNDSLDLSINSLLGMTDPNFKAEENVPPPVPVPDQTGAPTSTPAAQLQSDEELARQLAAEADREAGYEPVQWGQPNTYQRNQQQPQRQEQEEGGDFFKDDLPVIKEKIAIAADTTKKKAKELFEKFKTQVQRVNEGGYNREPSDARYTNLPSSETDNELIQEVFYGQQYSGGTSGGPQAAPPRLPPRKPTLNDDSNDDDDAKPRTREPIRIIREDSRSHSPVTSSTSDASVSPKPYTIDSTASPSSSTTLQRLKELSSSPTGASSSSTTTSTSTTTSNRPASSRFELNRMNSADAAELESQLASPK